MTHPFGAYRVNYSKNLRRSAFSENRKTGQENLIKSAS